MSLSSAYEYIDIEDLEDYASEDYSEIDPDRLWDKPVYAKISNAERLVNSYCGASFTAPVPDGVIFATLDISKRMIYRWMRENGMALDKEKLLESKKPYFTDEVKEALRISKKEHSSERSLYIK